MTCSCPLGGHDPACPDHSARAGELVLRGEELARRRDDADRLPADVAVFVGDARLLGWSYDRIAGLLGVTKQRVAQIVKAP